MSETFGPQRADGTPPPEQQVGLPPPARLHPAADQARLAAQLLEPAIGDLRKEIQKIRDDHQRHLLIVLSAFAAGFIALGTMTIGAYRWSHDDLAMASVDLGKRADRLDDKVEKEDATLVRVQTQLEDLLARIPPVPTPAPRR